MESLVKRIWYKNLARIRGTCYRGVRPKVSATCPPSTTNLPLEIIEIIITHLIHDTPSLLACSLTCSSWYTAVVPRLHRTLTVRTANWPEKKFLWPNPFRHMHRLGLLPLVKKLQVHEGYLHGWNWWLTPKQLDCRTLRHFFALTNVQELEIDHLHIRRLMPRIRRYFKNFLPTLRSLALRGPRGSHSEILYFVGLFQHLEDLKLCYKPCRRFRFPMNGPPLIPLFAPPLRGRLTMTSVSNINLLKDMVHLFGGIRFRYMDLFDVETEQFWIDACSGTLETLRLYPVGERLSLKGARVLVNHFVVESSLLNFDLSRHRSLRTLEVSASCVHGVFNDWFHYELHCESRDNSPDIASRLLKHVLSTITSPALEVVVVYRDYDFCGVRHPGYPTLPPVCRVSQDKRAREALQHHRQLRAFREMHKLREFRLVLCAEVWHRIGEHSVRVLEEAVAVEKAKGGFDIGFPEPLVVYRPRESQTTLGQDYYGNATPKPWSLIIHE